MWTTPKHSSTAENVLPVRNACSGKALKGDVYSPEAIYLRPGDLYAGLAPARITTVLGSCVAITMYDPKSHAAAMCHVLQPVCPSASSGCRMNCREKYKSVRCAVDEMLRRMNKMCVPGENLSVKVFGGAALLGGTEGRRAGRTVGEQNAEESRRVLVEYGLHVHVMEVGGALGRKVIFDTADGTVFLKRIESIRAR